MTMKVHEIFESICGEGPVIGVPAIFIRLYGCNLKCDFCDTKQDDFYDISVNDVSEAISASVNGTRVVCWTGGEPTIQLNEMLRTISLLKTSGFDFDHIVETNGTIITADIVKANKDKISVWIISPKDNQTAKYWITAIHDDKTLVNMIHLKFVISSFDELPSELGNMRFYVQPKLTVDGDSDPVSAFKSLVEQMWKFIVIVPNVVILPQLHKIMGVR